MFFVFCFNGVKTSVLPGTRKTLRGFTRKQDKVVLKKPLFRQRIENQGFRVENVKDM